MRTHPSHALLIAYVIAAPCGVFFAINMDAHWVSHWIAGAPIFGLALPAVIWCWWVRRRALCYIRNHRYHVCGRCLYPLAEIQAPTCPECGTPFTLPDLVTYWATVEEETDWSKGD